MPLSPLVFPHISQSRLCVIYASSTQLSLRLGPKRSTPADSNSAFDSDSAADCNRNIVMHIWFGKGLHRTRYYIQFPHHHLDMCPMFSSSTRSSQPWPFAVHNSSRRRTAAAVSSQLCPLPPRDPRLKYVAICWRDCCIYGDRCPVARAVKVTRPIDISAVESAQLPPNRPRRSAQ